MHFFFFVYLIFGLLGPHSDVQMFRTYSSVLIGHMLYLESNRTGCKHVSNSELPLAPDTPRFKAGILSLLKDEGVKPGMKEPVRVACYMEH